MEWTKITLGKRKLNNKKVRGKKKKLNFKMSLPTAELLCVALGSILLGRAIFLGELMPLGAAVVAAGTVLFPANSWLILFAAIGGVASVKTGWSLILVIVALISVYASSYHLALRKKNQPVATAALAGAVNLTVKSCGVALTQSPTLYDYFCLLFEAFFIVIFSVLFYYALRPLLQLSEDRRRLRPEELFGLIVMAFGIIAGTQSLKVGPLSLQSVLAKTAVLIAAGYGGFGLGAAAGALIGMIPGFSYLSLPQSSTAFAFLGLMTGLGRIWWLKKWGAVVGFLCAGVFLAVYIEHRVELLVLVWENIVAVFIYLLLPLAEKENERSEEKKETEENLLGRELPLVVTRWTTAIREIEKTVKEVCCSQEENLPPVDLSQLILAVSRRNCDGCSRFKYCWEVNARQTYKVMLELFALAEVHGSLKENHLPDAHRRICPRGRELAITVSFLSEIYKLERNWSSRLQEGRGLLLHQLDVLSRLGEILASSLPEGGRSKVEEQLKKRLNEYGLHVEEIRSEEPFAGRNEYEVTLYPCGGRLLCTSRLAPLISELTGQPYQTLSTTCWYRPGSMLCSVRLYRGLNAVLRWGAAVVSRDETVCGDSYAFVALPAGRVAVILSDGTGWGEQAARESRAVVNLVARLLSNGLGAGTVVEMVNEIMLLKAPADAYPTLDLAIIDVYHENVEIYKVGAAPSYLVRSGHVQVLRADALPAGVIGEIRVVPLRCRFRSEDALILTTDGALGTVHAGEWEELLRALAPQIRFLPPLEVARLLLSCQLKDDATVLVICWQKNVD